MLAVLIPVLLGACSTGSISVSDLHGGYAKTWRCVEFWLDGKKVDFDHTKDDFVIFKYDGEAIFDFGSTFKDSKVIPDDVFRYKVEGNKLIISDLESLHKDGKQVLDIIKLTPDEVVVERDYAMPDGKVVRFRQFYKFVK